MTRMSFRALLIVHVCLAVFGLVMEFATQSMLPDPLVFYIEQRHQAPISHTDALLLLVLLILFVALLASWIGLWKFWPWAPRLYAALCGIGILLQPLLGPVVVSGWTAALYDAASITAGVLLAGVFLTRWRDEFLHAVKRHNSPQGSQHR